jgi:hypothetical protein
MPAKNLICAAAIMASLTISRTGLPQSAASIMASLGCSGADFAIRRKILARSSGTRRHSFERGFRHRHRRIDILGRGVGDFAERPPCRD